MRIAARPQLQLYAGQSKNLNKKPAKLEKLTKHEVNDSHVKRIDACSQTNAVDRPRTREIEHMGAFPCVPIDCTVIVKAQSGLEAVMFALGVAGSVVLLAINGFHIYWLLGGAAGSDAYVPLGKNGKRPVMTKPQMLAGICMFFAAALLPLFALGLFGDVIPSWIVNVCLMLGIGVFLLRGIAGFIQSLMQPKPREKFHTWNIRLYTWVCLFLAISYSASLLYDW
ncbi:DUF3995 domain-containing protein [Gordonibacter sp. 28C]|uniref:DUF3995 domain-containing protein n=1 Tax=Gordonibacter sp. 28C TaxID=2078569 RepID=UPI0011C08042|nr:DUF3995 domain-containing protein [Gordonibacter sp. 28C]